MTNRLRNNVDETTAPHFFYLILGVGLLPLVIQNSDADLILAKLTEIGFFGAVSVLAVYFVGFLIDTASWNPTIERLGGRFRRLYDLWKIRMVGEAFNIATPLGTMGGEPVKAALLKNVLGVAYDQGIASQVLAKTINLIALVAYLCIGYGLILLSPQFSVTFKYSAGIGLLGFSRTGSTFFLTRFGKPLHKWLEGMKSFERELLLFYSASGGLFSRATSLPFLNWIVGTMEVFVIAIFLGSPISIWDAWILESAVQLTRAATFFIPLSLGTQEGALFMVTAAITGDGAFGVAISLVKRLREIVWIAWGFAIGWRMPFTSKTAP
jgi:glycosyltransferase 2 family protein